MPSTSSSLLSSELATRAPAQYTVWTGIAATDQGKVAQIWMDSAFGHVSVEQDRARYEWFYLHNPQGEGQINFLSAADSPCPVGFLGVGARRWVIDGVETPAGVLVDFVVHPRHRTAAPALLLQRRARERAAAAMSVLYGLPDTKAVAIFKRLGSQFTCELPRYARVVQSRVYLSRYLPSWLAQSMALFTDTLDLWGMRLRLLGSSLVGEWIDQFDERFDELWQARVAQGCCMGVRDRSFLEWRFRQQPGRTYRIFVIRERSSAALKMYFVCELTNDALVIKDVLNAGSERQSRQGLLMISLAARALGAVAVSIQMFGNSYLARALRKAQFVERDRRPFFASVSEPLRDRAMKSAWYITQADEDI